MDERLPNIPEFKAVREFIIWWEGQEMTEFRRRNPASVAALRSDPRLSRWFGYIEKTFIDRNADTKAAPLQDGGPGGDLTGRFGKYRIDKKLGEGGMGAVYLAYDTALSRRVAIKIIASQTLSRDDETFVRFMREARMAAKLSHPNMLQVYEVSETDGRPFIAMEFASGGTLEELWEGNHSEELPDADQISYYAGVMADIAEALDSAHKAGMVHRDIKPSNILLQAGAGGGVVPKLSDFGLAKDISAMEGLTVSGVVMGTPLYMSPEQAAGLPVDALSDVFSLGAVLYKFCAGKTPFSGDTIVEILQAVADDDPEPASKMNPAVDYDLETIMMKAMAKEKERRYASAREFADDIRRYLAGDTIFARPSTIFYKTSKQIKKHRIAFAGIVAAVTAIFALTAIMWVVSVNKETKRRAGADIMAKADAAFKKGDLSSAAEGYSSYIALLGEEDVAVAKLATARKMIEAEVKAGEEANDLAQKAWLLATEAFQGLYKKDSNPKDMWEKADRARGMLDESVSKKPTVLGYFYRGMIYRERYEWDLAVADFARSVELDPDFRIGVVMGQFAKFEKSVEFLLNAWQNKYLLETSLVKFQETVESAVSALAESKKRKAKGSYADLDRQFSAYVRITESFEAFSSDPDKTVESLTKGYEEYRNEEFLLMLGIVKIYIHLKNKDMTGPREAMEYFARALSSRQRYVFPMLFKGSMEMGRMQGNTALATFTEVIETLPFNHQGYFNRAVTYASGNAYEKEAEDLDKTLKIKPDFGMAYHQYGVFYENTGDMRLAERNFRKFVELEPDQFFSYFTLASFLTRRGRYAEALPIFDKACELSPKEYISFFQRGFAKEMINDYRGAKDDYIRAVALDDSDSVVFSRLGSMYLLFSEPEKALPNLDKAVELMASLSDSKDDRDSKCFMVFNRALVKRGLGDEKGYIEDIKRTLEINPDYIAALKKWLDYCDRNNMYVEAVAAYERLIPAYPDDMNLKINLAIAYDYADRFEDSIKMFDALTKEYPKVYSIYHNRGATLMRAGRYDKAAQDFEEAIRLYPMYAIAHAALGACYVEFGKGDEALASAEKALSLDANSYYAKLIRGEARLLKGEVDKALEDVEAVFAARPEYADAYALRGQCRAKKGLKKEALEDLEKAVSMKPKLALELDKVIQELKK